MVSLKKKREQKNKKVSTASVNKRSKREEVTRVEHSLLKEHPGKVYLHIWGWANSTDWLVPSDEKGNVIGNLGYMHHRTVIDESFKWGANLFEREGSQHHNWVLVASDAWNYKDFDDKEKRSILKELSYARDHGMLFGGTIIRRAGGLYPKDFLSDWFDALEKELVIDSMLEENFGSELKRSPVEIVNEFLEYNPGFVFRVSRPSYYRKKSPPIVPQIDIPLNLVQEFACGGGGYDDQVLDMDPTTKATYKDFEAIDKYEYSTRYGRLYTYSQINARGTPTIWVRIGPHAYFGKGWCRNDWIIKQVNDFLRSFAKNPKQASPTGIYFLYEHIVYSHQRPYVYGIGQDPIKCAVTYYLEVTGKDSPVSFLANDRYPFSYKTSFIQNNYLRCYIHPDKDGGILVYDVERTAHYDVNSRSMVISPNFIETVLIPEPEKENQEWSKDYSNWIGDYQKEVTYIEPAGYKAVLEEKINSVLTGTRYSEKRRYTILNDTPYLTINIEREMIEGLYRRSIGTSISCEGYDELTVGSKRYDSAIRKRYNNSKIVCLRSRKREKPEMVIFLLGKGNIKNLRWTPNKALIFESPLVTKEAIKIAVMIPTDLYHRKDLIHLYRYLSEKEQVIINKQKIEVINKYPIPLVKVVRIKNPRNLPYLVNEYGWWVFRGAQASKEHCKRGDDFLRLKMVTKKYTGDDYLKVYLKPNGEAAICPHGYINNIVKPGWGCQYILALRNVEKTNNGGRCEVKVLGITPLIFAPRIEFKEKVKSVRLNGRHWYYFEGKNVFLPNKLGVYSVEVKMDSKKEISPCLTRTFAKIEDMGYKNKTLTIDMQLPEWVNIMPEEFKGITAIIGHNGYKVKRIWNAEIVRSRQNKTLIRFKPGKVSITFAI